VQDDANTSSSMTGIAVIPGLAVQLGRRRQAEGYAFLDERGRPWTNEGPARAFLEEAYQSAGLRRPGQMWHVLRHSFASVLAPVASGARWSNS
jgi:site-specific recombinase XerD